MRKVNSVDLAGLNDFFDTAQMNMKNTWQAELIAEAVQNAVRAEREEIIAILSRTEFTSLDHMPSEAALIIRMRGGA